MQILSYFVPHHLRTNFLIRNLHLQFQYTGKLSQAQTEVLEDVLEIELDFYGWDIPVQEDQHEDFTKLLKKFRRNRFKSVKNKCVRAMNSIIAGEHRQDLIDDVLGRHSRICRGSLL